jgi:hypothetical protein
VEATAFFDLHQKRPTEDDEGDEDEEEETVGDEFEESDWEVVNMDADVLYSSACELVTAAAVCAVRPVSNHRACVHERVPASLPWAFAIHPRHSDAQLLNWSRCMRDA